MDKQYNAVKELTIELARLIGSEITYIYDKDNSTCDDDIETFNLLLTLNKVYFHNILLGKFDVNSFKNVVKQITKNNNIKNTNDWLKLYNSTESTGLNATIGGGIDFNSIFNKTKNFSSKVYAILNDEDIKKSTGKIMNIIKGKGEQSIEDLIEDIYIDLDKDVQNFTNKLQDKISSFDALLNNENIFRHSPEKCKTIFYPTYRELMNYNIMYDEDELKNYIPTQEVLLAYNNFLLDNYLSNIENRIIFEKNNNIELVKNVDKLIAKNKANIST